MLPAMTEDKSRADTAPSEQTAGHSQAAAGIPLSGGRLLLGLLMLVCAGLSAFFTYIVLREWFLQVIHLPLAGVMTLLAIGALVVVRRIARGRPVGALPWVILTIMAIPVALLVIIAEFLNPP